MNNFDSWLRRLYNNANNFKWEKYTTPKKYYGLNIQTMPLHGDTSCRSICGFVITFPYQNIPSITYDYDLKVLKVDDKLVKNK